MLEKLRFEKRRIIWAMIIEILIIVAYGILYFLKADEWPILKETYIICLFFVVITIIPVVTSLLVIHDIEIDSRKNSIKIANTLGANIDKSFSFGQIGLVSYNELQEINWFSTLLEERSFDIMGHKIMDVFPEVTPLMTAEKGKENESVVQLTREGHSYDVTVIRELSLLVFKDVSETKKLKDTAESQAPVFATIYIDNLSDWSVSTTVNEEFVITKAKIHGVLTEWGRNNNFYLQKVTDDVYVAIMQENQYQILVKNGFKILNDVSEVSSEHKFTLSIGFGRGATNYSKLAQLSNVAINVAQTRGGNQVVTNNFAGFMNYYGGLEAEVRNDRNIIKSRQIASSLHTYISQYEKVFAIVHKGADFDALASALAIGSIAKSLNKEFYIVAEEKQFDMSARIMFTELIPNPLSLLLDERKALELLNDKTLVVAVDVNSPHITTAELLIGQAKSVIVIDHHRKSDTTIDHPLMEYVDVNASSASEIITQLIKDMDAQIKITKEVATFLIAGILLDTKDLTVNTETATYKAIIDLKGMGGDNTLAHQYMKEEYETAKLKSKVLSELETLEYGIVLGIVPEDYRLTSGALASICDAALKIKGIKAAFIIGNTEPYGQKISARSDGSINVQLIMEKLGGGGHYASAAASFDNTTFERIKELLQQNLENYSSELKGDDY